MEITLTPTIKQDQAWQLLEDQDTRFIGFGGGAGCFIAGTLVQTQKGLEPIENIEIGDFVYSVENGNVVLKKVVETFSYGGSEIGQKMIELSVNDGTKITCTPAHRFFIGGDWLSAKDVAKRALEENKRKLSNLQQRAIVDKQLEELETMEDNETSLRWEWLSENDDKAGSPKNSKNAQTGCSGVHTKSRKQTTSESQELQQGGQQSGESGMGNGSRELETLPKKHERVSGANGEEKLQQRCEGGNCRNVDTNRKGSEGDTCCVEALHGDEKVSCGKIRGKTSNNKRHCVAKELETRDIVSVSFLKPQDVYDLSVEDTETYLVTENSYITHNSGKSWLIAEYGLVNAIRYPGSRGFIARNELKRLMNSTFVTFRKVCKHHKIPEGTWTLDGKYNVIQFNNGSTIDLLDIAYKPTDPEYERFGSTEYTWGAIEEAGETHFKAFDVLKSRVGRHNIFEGTEVPGKILCTMNPNKGWIYRIFYKPWARGELEKPYAFVQALYSDNPHTAKSYEQQLDEIEDAVTRARLKDGEWEYDDDESVLCKYEHIVDLFSNTILLDGTKFLVVDAARFGSDRIVFGIYDGLELQQVIIRTKQSTVTTKEQIVDICREHQIPYSQVIVDEDGVGGGIVDQLPGIKGFVANSTPFTTKKALRRQLRPGTDTQGNRILANFDSLKTQCIYKLSELITDHKMAVKAEGVKDDLTDELSAQLRGRDIDKDGKLKAITKEDVKEVIGHSPDLCDIMIMRMYFVLQEESVGRTYTNPASIIRRNPVYRKDKQPRGV